MIDPQDTLTEGEQREIRHYIRSTLGGPEVPRDELSTWLANLIDRAERAESDNAQLRINLAETGEILAINRRAVRELNDKLVDLKASSSAEADQFNAGYEAGEKGELDPFADQPHYEPDYDSWRNGYYAGSYDRLTKELVETNGMLSHTAIEVNDLLAELAALKERTRWIPVSERLPLVVGGYDVVVSIMTPQGTSQFVAIRGFMGIEDGWSELSGTVTHWKERPFLPPEADHA